jgi:threonyl-tRNA synthetase
MIKLKLPDGKILDVAEGKTYGQVCAELSPSLRKKTVVAKVNGKLTDLSKLVESNADLTFVTTDDAESFEVLNHSTAHLLAQAVKRLYPKVWFWVGPPIDEGFYYDMDLHDKVLNDEDLAVIEKEMKKIIEGGGAKIEQKFVSKQEALQMFKDNPYKVELINNLPSNEKIGVYSQGEFVDLCRGPHVENTKELKYFKLLKASGAYYKGDSKNKMLQRIYGVCFSSKEKLEAHLNMLEEAKKRDHKRLGKDLELFTISEYGPGFPFFLPNGMILKRLLEDYWFQEHTKEGYKFIQTPIMLSKELWETSGHWKNYKESMYLSEIEEREFAIKPMNCPGAILVYKNGLHSYRDLPLRLAEVGLVHRYESSGALNGLFRVRNFTQDDAHIFVTEDMIESEILRFIKLLDRVYNLFGLTYDIELSTRPEEKYIGAIDVWDKAEKALENACIIAGKKVKMNPGDGAFYGPKLDFKVKDSIGRVWQCGTIQLDMNLPDRFEITYIDESGNKRRPIMLHRVIFGSIERFIGILIEHYAGAFPTWLAPVQVMILPVNNEFQLDHSKGLLNQMLNHSLRAELDERQEKLGYRLRAAQLRKIPYTIVVGDKEKAENLVTYRKFGSEEQTTVTLDNFLKLIEREVKEKTNNIA